MNKISEITDYKFVYTSNLEIDKIIVTVNENEREVKEVITSLFKEADISHTIKGKQVVLTAVNKKVRSDLEQPRSGEKIESQSKFSVKGVVIDASTGQILPGAYIKIKNKNRKLGSILHINNFYELLITFVYSPCLLSIKLTSIFYM